ncbi:MAG TPA: preprotein translocase subunit YajC [Syntrophorhabdaceae bacterium]|nr:preprotein translocase subunit YajC [Syntrophorhabdaceae bacterium]HQM80586.1 preprotein translocase subunit YajC [Syntrophorhabdaceae bacterium]
MNIAYAMGSQPAGGQGGANQWMSFLPLILLFVVFYFLLIRPQQKRAKQQKTFIENLKKGDKIITSSGLYGTITGITDDAITIEIAEKVRVKVAKNAVASLQPT